MFGVCFRSEKHAAMQDQWSFAFSNFGVTELWEIRKEDGEDIYQPTIGITTAEELPTDRPLVILAPQDGRYVQGTEPLKDFVHPDNAIYLFGGSHENLSEVELGSRVPDHLVYIDLVQHECFAHAAGYITLWDRYVKRGGHG